MQDISGTNDSDTSKWLSIKPGETAKFTLLATKVKEPKEEGFSATISIRHDKVEKDLNLSTVLRNILETRIKEKVIKVGSILQVKNDGKPKGKNYFKYTVMLVKK